VRVELSYSTDPDWCSKCKHLPCVCKQAKAAPPSPAGKVVKMRREMRRGKPVIVLFELPLRGEALKQLLKDIQKSCGAGGAIKDGTLEIQGDHRERIEQILAERGYKAKRAGG
jgi:translation initiation factor 1